MMKRTIQKREIRNREGKREVIKREGKWKKCRKEFFKKKCRNKEWTEKENIKKAGEPGSRKPVQCTACVPGARIALYSLQLPCQVKGPYTVYSCCTRRRDPVQWTAGAPGADGPVRLQLVYQMRGNLVQCPDGIQGTGSTGQCAACGPGAGEACTE
jgi:hypothetical protein